MFSQKLNQVKKKKKRKRKQKDMNMFENLVLEISHKSMYERIKAERELSLKSCVTVFRCCNPVT